HGSHAEFHTALVDIEHGRGGLALAKQRLAGSQADEPSPRAGGIQEGSWHAFSRCQLCQSHGPFCYTPTIELRASNGRGKGPRSGVSLNPTIDHSHFNDHLVYLADP